MVGPALRLLMLPTLLLVSLSGCLSDEVPEALDVQDVAAWTWSAWDGVQAWTEGPAAVAPGMPLRFAGDCAGRCDVAVSVADAPDDAWLEVLVTYDGTAMVADLEAAPGLGGEVQRGFDAVRWVGPARDATVSVLASGPVEGRVRLLGPDVPALTGDLMLPNIVTMAPVQVHVGACGQDEQSEQGASRCLRLGNAIGNPGDGPLQVVLPFEQGALTPAGMGSFDQRVLLRGGGYEERPVGNADLHLSHGHLHYDGFARFSLYQWDEATGLRGELAAQHHKSGFCFLDWGEMQEPDRAPSQQDHAEDECLIPGDEGWTMGVTAGWFDFYWSSLADQYVDVPGVPDGTYELVSTADWSDSLVETDETDNSASVIIRLVGDDVEVLEERSFYRIPEGTSNL